MAQVVKCYLGIWLLLLLCVVQAGILKLGAQTVQAQNYFRYMETELENSHFAQQVAEDLMKEAGERGYQAVITIQTGEEGSGAFVKLVVPFQWTLLHINTSKEMEVTL